MFYNLYFYCIIPAFFDAKLFVCCCIWSQLCLIRVSQRSLSLCHEVLTKPLKRNIHSIIYE